MTLPPFSGLDSTCPKCGTRGLKVRFLRTVGDATYGSLAYQKGSDIFPCMQRTCPVCSFETLEAPQHAADAALAPAPEKQTEKSWTHADERKTDYSGLDI